MSKKKDFEKGFEGIEGCSGAFLVIGIDFTGVFEFV
jgi:hypothetical protein